ncbi:MAG: helix-hairpin-helix domain-containing protein, partial [Synergistaceae bacterium]|nr:helix-hairpin-helix domain-containing protein [Synergistaceae bacterium]
LAAPLEDGTHVHVPGRSESRKRDSGAVESTVVSSVVVARPGRRTNAGRTQTAGPIDINRATAEDLTALKGIGPVLAKNIVEDRNRNGLFRSVEDLLRVNGIGNRKLEGFRKSVIIGP